MNWSRTVIAAVRRNWWRLVFAAVGAVAAVVSYGHIVNLFLSWHASLLDARLMPIAIDGLIIIGAGAAKSGQVWLGWSAIGPGLAASLYANVMNGLPYGRGAAMGSGWATVALFLATNVMERWKPAQVSGVAGGGTDVAELPDLGNIVTEVPATLEPPLATPVPPPDQVRATNLNCGHGLAQTPSERVVDDYLHTRDCLGEIPSQRRLAATHGMSRPKVAALVGHLNGSGQPG